MTNKIVKTISFDGGVTTYELKDEQAREDIGNIANLDTTAKTDLVSAINELTARPVITMDSTLSPDSPNPVQNATITNALNSKQDTLIAGDNITISGNTISASTTGATYTAGDNIQISEQNVISATNTEYTAGTGIAISNENVISATSTGAFSASCPAITPINGIATWEITHNLGTENLIVCLYTDDTEVGKKVEILSNNVVSVSFPVSESVTAGDYEVTILANGGASGGSVVPTKDKLPLFYSIWSPVKMPNSWVKATDTFLSKSDYPTQYEYLVDILNGDITDTGLSVKTSTTTYDDYDFVINTTEETFRLPLLNGTEFIEYTDGVISNPGIVSKTSTSPVTWDAPYNCTYEISVTMTSSTKTMYFGKSLSYYGDTYQASSNTNHLDHTIKLTKGQQLYIAFENNSISAVNVEHIYKHKGYGDLYFLFDTSSSGSSGANYTAGDNISISNNVISATYTAGNNISITNGEIAFNDPNFIPTGTTLTVELDGSGDFDNFEDAISYIRGKWSNGEVNIQFGSGIFDTPINYYMDFKDSNIKQINILGSETGETIFLTPDTLPNDSFAYYISNCNILFSKIHFKLNTASFKFAIISDVKNLKHTSCVTIKDCTFTNFARALWIGDGNKGILQGTNNVNNFSENAFVAQAGEILFNYGRINFNNTSTQGNAFFVNSFGMIKLDFTYTSYTNVNTVSNIAWNSTGNIQKGFICGVTTD